MAHDVANNIVEIARELEKLDSLERVCTVKLIFCKIIEHAIEIIPCKKYLLVKYKSVEFRCTSLENYKIIVKYLLRNIYQSCLDELNCKIEWESFIPELDEHFSENHELVLMNNTRCIFSLTFEGEDFLHLMEEHFIPLYFINHSHTLI